MRREAERLQNITIVHATMIKKLLVLLLPEPLE